MKFRRRGFLNAVGAALAFPALSRIARAQGNSEAKVAATTAGERLSVDNLYDRVREGFANNDGVRIHYVTIGEGPLILFIHGIPDQWFVWQHQIVALADSYKVVAISQRGYNKSDKPKGVDNYDIRLLMEDVAAVFRQLDRKHGVVVGHDSGGTIAWHFALRYPEMLDALVIFNTPHPRARRRELALNKEQQERSAYMARITTTTGDISGEIMDQFAERRLAGLDSSAPWYQHYVEAYHQSDREAMLNFYRSVYGPLPWEADQTPLVKIQSPVLMFHGLDDRAFVHEALNDTWELLDKDLTLVTLPGVGHVSENTGPIEFENGMLKAWLGLKGI
jgi:epoxide hydrolase 4